MPSSSVMDIKVVLGDSIVTLLSETELMVSVSVLLPCSPRLSLGIINEKGTISEVSKDEGKLTRADPNNLSATKTQLLLNKTSSKCKVECLL